ncbi:hypothetical protein [Variovorax guangxiensis]|uniref:Uncharacterized protein n=1 Tax=Variovorax guangxiensis TaxID=1775474 RepID=A0A840G6P5_9BURK|nr:hypothetical protein [Variovorax guangxiensis]MBB4224921.1 hypothetical protein [Variovorax guangxiensis]
MLPDLKTATLYALTALVVALGLATWGYRTQLKATSFALATAFCNNQRHAMFPKAAPDAQTYETFVLLCVAAGLWHQHAGN